jgi:hypothetical protein
MTGVTQEQAQTMQREAMADENGVSIRPALEVLSRLRQGQVMDLLSIELNRVVNGVKDCSVNKSGTVTLTLTVAPVQKQANAVFIQAKVVGKAPEDPPDSDLLFYDDDGNLHTRDPRQRDIFDDGPLGVDHGA